MPLHNPSCSWVVSEEADPAHEDVVEFAEAGAEPLLMAHQCLIKLRCAHLMADICSELHAVVSDLRQAFVGLGEGLIEI